MPRRAESASSVILQCLAEFALTAANVAETAHGERGATAFAKLPANIERLGGGLAGARKIADDFEHVADVVERGGDAGAVAHRAADFERLLVHLQRAAQVALTAAEHAEAIEVGAHAALVADRPAYRERLFVARPSADHIAALGKDAGRFVQRPRDALPVSRREVKLLRLSGCRERALRIA